MYGLVASRRTLPETRRGIQAGLVSHDFLTPEELADDEPHTDGRLLRKVEIDGILRPIKPIDPIGVGEKADDLRLFAAFTIAEQAADPLALNTAEPA